MTSVDGGDYIGAFYNSTGGVGESGETAVASAPSFYELAQLSKPRDMIVAGAVILIFGLFWMTAIMNVKLPQAQRIMNAIAMSFLVVLVGYLYIYKSPI